MQGLRLSLERVLVGVLAALVAVVGLLSSAAPAEAEVAPVEQRPAAGVTADGLPTVQIDGVVWDQEVVGDTVYAGGQFSYARPAGSPAGVNQVKRTNILAYNIRTGELITSFAPNLNGQVKSITASPDGKRIYVGGSFTTTSDGTVNRYRLAAFNTSDGSLVTTFAAGVNAAVSAVAVTNSAVYVGGAFTSVGSAARPHLAAFNPTNGALLGWAPTVPDGTVTAMTMTPDNSRVIVGGSFSQLNTTTATGLGAIDAVSGATLPWTANQVVKNYGNSAAITGLATDGDTVYGSGYWYGGTGNFEGAFAADPNSGDVKWLADCHGDTYDVGAAAGAVYAVSHWHYCSNIGGFPDTNPRNQWYRSNAMSVDAKGTVAPNGQGGYADFQGYGAPAMINWFPTMDIGTFTGQSQAGWTTEGNSQYLVQGGEFLKVNGVPQQGLVRFAIPSLSTNQQGPRLSGVDQNPSLLNLGNGSVRIKWQTNWDRDDQVLTYEVQRQGTAAPIFTTTATSQFWNRPFLSFNDTTTQAGKTYNYRISAYDASGNKVTSNYVSITPRATSSPYYAQVVADGASDYWRMGNSGGFPDYVGNLDLSAGTGTKTNVSGAITGDPDGSATFDGTENGTAGASTTTTAPNVFTAEAWINTTTTAGGKILGFGDSQLNQSSNYDRHVYMDNAGRIIFGVYPGSTQTVQTSKAYNDGEWHHLAAELSPAGMVLYVDGLKIGVNASTTSGQPFVGRWRVGGDNIGGWPNQPSSYFFAGSIDDVAIYPTALSGAQVRDHYTKSGRTVDIPPVPNDGYGSAVYADNPTLFWRMDESTGSTAKDVSPNAQDGQYSGGENLGQPSPVTEAGKAVTFNGADGTLASKSSFDNPSVYTQEAWFNTTTTNGGKIIGFGNTQSGTSSSYDRHVYMETNGQVTFGTWTGQTNLATSPGRYNDGNWHQVVASQGSDGMKLYMDGQLVATNGQTQAQAYAGFWRVGGDANWCCQAWFAGSIDEVAVYDAVLAPARVLAHYQASPAAVNNAPQAKIAATCDAGACGFDGTGSTDPDGSIASYAWEFGDGTVSSDPAPTHGYDVSGTYTVKLTVTDNKGAQATATRSVSVTVPPANQLPVAAATVTCDALDCTFDGSASSDPDGSIDAYAWTFGDGTTSSVVQPTHSYSADGTYNVVLKVTDNRGGTATITKSVTVKANLKPVPSFVTSCADLVCGFNSSGSSDPDGTVAAFSWSFGDGSADSTDANPSHTFDQPGTYQVKLTVTDDRGATASKTTTVTVTVNSVPVASFTANCAGLTCAPDGSGSSDSDGTIASYSWTFGDGTPAVTGKKPAAHTYDNPGSFDITLTVTDDKGATATKTQTVTLSLPPNQAPVASFSSSCTQLSCAFDAGASTDADGSLVGYTWDFGDTTGANGARPTHDYATPGTYQVKLIVTDDRGASSSVTKPVTVAAATSNQPPVASFTSKVSGLRADIDASASSDADGTISGYAWDFGDGSTGTGRTASRTYATAGTYAVKLTVTDDKGASTSSSKSVTVAAAANQPPVPSFTTSVTGQAVAVDAAGSSDADGSITAYAWDFGDGSTGSGRSTSRTYAAAGTYTVKLTVTDDKGATASTTKSVTVAAADTSTLVKDGFNRTGTRWGTAETGGTWTYSGSTYSTNGSTGDVKIGSAGGSATASLTSVSARDVDVSVDVAVDKLATGGGFQTTLVTRKSSAGDYRLTARHASNGTVVLNLTKVVGSTSTSLKDVAVSTATYTPGSVVRVRFTAKGNGTTALAGKVWKVGSAEPTSPQITATDSTSALQTAGSFAIMNYVSGSSTNAPVTFSLDNLVVAAG